MGHSVQHCSQVSFGCARKTTTPSEHRFVFALGRSVGIKQVFFVFGMGTPHTMQSSGLGQNVFVTKSAMLKNKAEYWAR